MNKQSIRRGFATRAIHGDQLAPAEVPSTPASTPIYQTAGFAFDSLNGFDAAIDGAGTSFVYSRMGNPTVDALERLTANLEGGASACAYGSGIGAVHGALLACVRPGDHIVAPQSVYGGSHGLLQGLMADFGITTSFVPVTDLEAWRAAIQDNTKVLFAETITNPTLEVVDLPALATLAHGAGAKLLVDATFTTPYVLRPLEQGADLVIHSATKYLGGHGDLIAGLVTGGEEVMAAARRALVQSGGIMAPFVAWLILRGMKTLPLRMDRHMSSALKVAEFLQAHPAAEGVRYPGLPDHPDHERAKACFEHGFGGVVCFQAKGGDEAARRVVDKLQLFRTAGSLGDVHSLAIPPAVASHRAVPADERLAMGMGPGFIRLSVGLEESEDLIDDLRSALD